MEPNTSAFAQLEEVILRETDSGELVGLAVALVKGEEIVWCKGYGLADLETETPITPATSFSVQSVTKPVVATALMQWYERGRFQLDDRVNEHLAPLRIQNEFEETAPVTIRHLLTHTSGLPVDIGASTPPLAGQRTLEEYLATVAKTTRPSAQEIVYANWGYDVIGYLVGRFAGQAYNTYLREHVLEPLGMRSSAIGEPVQGRPLARGHFLSAVDGKHHAAEPFPWPTEPASPAGSLFSTVEDLGHFVIAHLNGGEYQGRHVLTRRAVAEMQRLHARAGPSRGGMGLGFRVERANGHRLFCHAGDGLGYTAFIGAYPDEKVGVALLINTSNAQTARSVIANAALRILAGDYAPRDIATLKQHPAPEEWDRLTGSYLSTYWDIHGTVTVEDGCPVLNLSHGLLVNLGGAKSYLEPMGQGLYRGHKGPFDGLELTFEFGDDGKASRFHGGLYPFRFERRGDAPAPTEVIADEKADLIGRWSGTVGSPLGPLPTTIAITDSARATVTALSARDAAVQEFTAAQGRVAGHFDVTVPGFGDFRVFLRLTACAGKLQGQAYARGSFGEFPMSTDLMRD